MSTQAAPASVVSSPSASPRIRVFVDYWNLQLTMNQRVSAESRQLDARFPVDWQRLPAWLAEKAARIAGTGAYRYEGGIVYASYNAKTTEGRKFHSWATTWLNRQSGIQVVCYARHLKNPPLCPVCHHSIPRCPRAECGADLTGTAEKGVDSAIVTDMIRLAWEDAYEIGVLASSDADMVPAVNFLNQKGRKIVQAGFPPSGVHLATACWASFDLFRLRDEIERK